MKVLLVDSSVSGHHKSYLQTLIDIKSNIEYICILPEKIKGLGIKTYTYKLNDTKGRSSVISYIKWIRYISKIVKRENIDVVHFLFSDSIYRYAGMKISNISAKVIVTQHQIRESNLRWFCLKRLSSKVDRVVVHTDYIKEQCIAKGLLNIEHIEYPITQGTAIVAQEEARKYWKIEEDDIVFVAAGDVRRDKGIDILLKALKKVEGNYHLIIAGVNTNITEQELRELINNCKGKISLHLRRLSDYEFSSLIAATNCVVLPYRKVFNGASGPLGIGVLNGKYIIGANHGSLGHIIEHYELGRTFETEDENKLALVLQDYIDNPVTEIGNKYIEYQNMLDEESFRNKYKQVYRYGGVDISGI